MCPRPAPRMELLRRLAMTKRTIHVFLFSAFALGAALAACGGSSTGGAPDAPAKVCGETGDTCAVNGDCCFNACDPTTLKCVTTGGMCAAAGADCNNGSDCCNLSCVSNK